MKNIVKVESRDMFGYPLPQHYYCSNCGETIENDMNAAIENDWCPYCGVGLEE